MNSVEQLASYKALHEVCAVGALDHLPEGMGERMGLKRIQFEAHPDLMTRLDNICGLLDVSKRRFLEAAVSDAITTAEQKFLAVYREAAGHEFGAQ